MSTYSLAPLPQERAWELPSRGTVAMVSLIIAESAIFTIFVVAYLFYIGKSLTGPNPQQVLKVPWFNTICLLTSSFAIWRAEHAIASGAMARFTTWLVTTITLGVV